MTIVVTGANGQLGRLVVEHLRKRGDASEIAVSVREPAKAQDLGVEVRQGDFDRPETLDFTGAEKLLIISTGDASDHRVTQHGNAIEAAKRAGVRHVFYTSLTKADSSSMLLARTHGPTEELLKASGLTYTILRNNWYLENDLGTIAAALATGTVASSAGDGRTAPVTRAEYAEAAAVALTTDGHENAIYELGSPVTYSYADWAAALSEATGREITFTALTDAQAAEQLTAAGLPAPVVEVLVDSNRGIAGGDLAVAAPDLAKLLGREPVTLREWVAAQAASSSEE
ncbi:SDR family oxidoreductase [Amycolatopsis sp. 195334CR]|uniref:SDR family oxidoreductase n=1 Tax=Amycolatopsis sp. 195334CR TaxID=2814588 RepID=UPI001A8E32B4|nr:SDR family oxidoreductase [Amycolatopsis sp. 195334CR]MBN6037852.1 SDR family oxidoreductase [Amycolatopsis sp. 195334CR]